MSETACRITICQKEKGITFRIEGNATLNQSPAVRLFAEQCLAKGQTDLGFHLGECKYMDSTFLGTILCLSKFLNKPGKGRLSLISPSEECRRLFKQMGIEEMLPVLEDGESLEGPWIPLNEYLGDLQTFHRVIVEAHQELATLPGPAGDQFRSVAKGLASEFYKK